ncbi:MAG: hypothetical protein QMC81_02990 [Thermoanaerobacterales bacterium]|nr:hypothetical protein [Thermoanaerobacterales bacterium]
MRLSAAEAEQAAAHFLRTVSSGDVAEAKTLAAGQVAYNVAQAGKNGLPKAEVVGVDTEAVAASDKWARVRATVELTLADGSPDVGFYELELVNEDGWKVVNVRETAPVVAGRGHRVSDEDLAEMRTVFERYLHLLAAGKYDQAAKECLAGPARRGQEAGASALGKAAVIKDVRNLKAAVLYGRDKLAVVDCRYRADERPVRVVATFWRTTQGWRVVGLVAS